MEGKEGLEEKFLTAMMTYKSDVVQQKIAKVQQMQRNVQQFCCIQNRQQGSRVATRFDAAANEMATNATDATIHATIFGVCLLHDKKLRYNDLGLSATNATKNSLKVYNEIEVVKKMRMRTNIHAYKIFRKKLLHLLHLLQG